MPQGVYLPASGRLGVPVRVPVRVPVPVPGGRQR
jgi:hypothetical protein